MKFPILSIFVMFISVIGHVSAKPPAPKSVKGAITIDTEYAKKLMNQCVVFIDVRSAENYKEGHIQSAVHLDLKKGLTESTLLSVVEKDQPVVFYCNGNMCQRSALASGKAIAWGWESVYYYRSGFPGWQKAE